jgi:D-sedoheptulose 7-phosphate isomerase
MPSNSESMMNERRNHVANYLVTLRTLLDELPLDAVERVMEVFEQAYRENRTIFVCGNGGSATTASHWVCDFAKGTVAEGMPRLRMIGLGDNPALLTAYANDVGYDQVFSEPLRTYARPGDVVVLMTASGNSPNVLMAAQAARDAGAVTVGLIGFGGGKLASMVDHNITVSCREYGPVEDLHLVLDHILSMYMRAYIARSAQ